MSESARTLADGATLLTMKGMCHDESLKNILLWQSSKGQIALGANLFHKFENIFRICFVVDLVLEFFSDFCVLLRIASFPFPHLLPTSAVFLGLEMALLRCCLCGCCVSSTIVAFESFSRLGALGLMV